MNASLLAPVCGRLGPVPFPSRGLSEGAERAPCAWLGSRSPGAGAGLCQPWCTGSAWSPAPGRRRRGEPIPSDALKLVPAWRGGDVSPASVSAWLHLPLQSSAGPCRGQEASSHTLRCSRAPAPFPSLGCSSFENKIPILYGTFLLSQAPKPASSERQALFKMPVGCFLIP